MNFDIKYATYLQIFNFIKIKQVLGIFLGAQELEEPSRTIEPTWVQVGDN